MSSLDKIPVQVEMSRHNLLPLLHEIRHALERLIDTGETRTIDLRSLPFSPGEEQELERRLGRGELVAQLDALGPSEILETRFPGVWLITHRNTEDEIIGRYVEVTAMPALLQSQLSDMQQGLKSLDEDLGGDLQPTSEAQAVHGVARHPL